RLDAAVEAIEALASHHQLPACHPAMDQGAQADPSPGGPGRLLVARRMAGCGAIRPVAPLAAVGARGPVAPGLLGTASRPDALCAKKGQESAGTGGCPHGV